MEYLAARVVAYLHMHWQEPLTLAQLAAHLHCRIPVLIRRCKTATGLTPHQLLISIRLDKAQELLRTTALTCTEIGTVVGFTDPSHFSATFHAKRGCSPQQYRDATRTISSPERLAIVTGLWGQLSQAAQDTLITTIVTLTRQHTECGSDNQETAQGQEHGRVQGIRGR